MQGLNPGDELQGIYSMDYFVPFKIIVENLDTYINNEASY
jgi:hypothetical protein